MTLDIHPSAAVGFGDATDYEAGRPDYPAAAIAQLMNVLKVDSESSLLDLGAGTGKFTSRLVGFGAKLIAVDPVAGMRKVFAEKFPAIPVLEGTAESIPLPDGSVDAVVVAQAFHWFDGKRALPEIARVLKPGGGLGLVWNARDESIPWIAALTKIIAPYEAGSPRYHTGEWRIAFEENSPFTPLQTRTFSHRHVGDEDMILKRILSISFIAALPPSAKADVAEKVRAVVRTVPPLAGAQYEMPYRTDVFWGFKKSQ
jgi:SAM-dependent methyltransferase